MSLNGWFLLCSWLVVPAWLLLLAAPRWRWTIPTGRYVVPLVLAVVYCGVVLTGGDSRGSLASLDDLQLRFSGQSFLLASWIHYLAMDLFVGAWEVVDSHATGLPRIVVTPCLVLTFFLAPAGLLLYLTARLLHQRARLTV